ncbi:MAG: RNA polymerase sigma factor [Acidobacteriota bacterium]
MSSEEQREAAEAEVDALVARAVEGDRQAFGELFELKRGLVFRVALHQLGDPEEARQVTQTVFVRLWNSLDRYDPSRRLDTWLYRVAINAAIDHHRRQAPRRREREIDETLSGGLEDERARPALEGGLQNDEIQRVLLELCELLGPKQRAAFLLREVEGHPTSEVAQTLDSTESTVRNHVAQARRILQRALRERYPEYAPVENPT